MKRTAVLPLLVLILLLAAALRLPEGTAVPPGLHYDEAANAILAAEIGLQGERPIFIPSYTGKEVLFFYLTGGVMRLVGPSVFSLRLTAAFVGLLTVAAAYTLARELLRDRRVALLAAALLAVSFWHLLFSRLGFRAITQPLLQALAVIALWLGWRRQDWRWLAASGVALGLAAYTYLAVRLFPLLLGVSLLPLLVGEMNTKGQRDEGTKSLKGRLGRLGIVVGVALIGVAPLLAYFGRRPEAFWVRIGQVAPGAAALSLWESVRRSLAMFFISGDPYIRFNVPERPLFSWLWGGLLLLGWLFVWRQWRRGPLERAGALLLALAPLIMLLPTALAVNEIVPSNLRAIGMLPFVMALPALGAVTLLDWLPRQRLLFPTLLLLTLGVGLGTAVHTYFQQWGQDPALYNETDADLAAMAAFLDELDTAGKRIYVNSLYFRHPTLAFLSQKYGQVNWVIDSAALPLPPAATAVYLFPRSSPLPDWMQPLLADAAQLETPLAPDGDPAFAAYELAAPPELAPAFPLTVNFDNWVTLLGYDAVGAVSGKQATLTLYWQLNGRPDANFTPFVHFEDAWGHRWSQVEMAAYPAVQWQPDERLVQRVEIPVPPGTPLGDYRMRVGLFDPETGRRLPRLDADGRFAGDSLVIAGVPVLAGTPPTPLPTPPRPVNAAVTPALALLGYEPFPNELAVGETLPLAFWWHNTALLPTIQTRLELMRTDQVGGRILETVQPVHDTYPFPSWAAPQFVIDRQTIQLPESLPPGTYELHARWLNRLDETLYTQPLGPLTVTAADRTFRAPPMQERVDADFADEITLLGYNLTPAAAGQFELSLVWQALTPPTTDYTVFVHLLTPDGSCNPCVWQQDAMPQQNQYPTSRWVADEIIVDTYQIVLPEGIEAAIYPLEVGLYVAETGQRLQAAVSGAPPADAVFLEPIAVGE